MVVCWCADWVSLELGADTVSSILRRIQYLLLVSSSPSCGPLLVTFSGHHKIDSRKTIESEKEGMLWSELLVVCSSFEQKYIRESVIFQMCVELYEGFELRSKFECWQTCRSFEVIVCIDCIQFLLCASCLFFSLAGWSSSWEKHEKHANSVTNRRRRSICDANASSGSAYRSYS